MNRKELSSALRKLGIKRGSIVMLHSSYLSLGPFEGGPEEVVNAFLDAVGPKGTLVVPVFGALGILTDVVKRRPGAVISPSPKGTVAALGPQADELVKEHWKADTVHGEDTPFTRLAALGGYICLLGVDEDRNTTLHTAEALQKLPYLSDTSATFKTTDGETVTKTWHFYPGPHRDFIGLEHYFRESDAIRIARIGNAQVRLMKAKEMLDICAEIGEQDPAFALCDNPACQDCVTQRAAIFADEMSREAFQLTASARLAGRYIPEMIENLKNAGISRIELDYIQGSACAAMKAERLAKAVVELTEAGISVSALRSFFTPAEPQTLFALAKAAGISRVIMPLSELSAGTAHDGITLSLVNNGQSSVLAAAIFAKADAADFTFSPAAFVKAAEHPFLYSYRIGRFIKTIGQLDLVDATWDGTATRFARGNGEVKELLSILRCHNFPGFVCLGGGAAYPGTLHEAAHDLIHLLENM